MEENIEHRMPIRQLAGTVGASQRELERLFNKWLGCSPSRFYVGLRLKHAQRLLTQSTESILDVALRCGFSDGSHLGRCFREVFQQTPAEVRRATQAALQMTGARSWRRVGERHGGSGRHLSNPY
jgi:transcriptional regulator GlxA family with amidase domain